MEVTMDFQIDLVDSQASLLMNPISKVNDKLTTKKGFYFLFTGEVMERIFWAISRMFFVFRILDIFIILSRSFLLSSAGIRIIQSSRRRSSSSVHDGKITLEFVLATTTGDPFPPEEDVTESWATEGGGFMYMCAFCCCCCCVCVCITVSFLLSFFLLLLFIVRTGEERKRKRKRKKIFSIRFFDIFLSFGYLLAI